MTCPVDAELCEQHCAAQSCTILRIVTPKLTGNTIVETSTVDREIKTKNGGESLLSCLTCSVVNILWVIVIPLIY